MAKDSTDDAASFVDEELTDSAIVSRLSSAFPDIRPVDPESVANRMADRVLGADTLDELFDSLTGKTSDALIGKAVEVVEVAWQLYHADNGDIPLAVVNGVDLATGEAIEFATTGRMMTAFLYRAGQIGAIPFKARITGKKTNSGQTALNFERV